MDRVPKIDIYQSEKNKDWYWRIVGVNGENIDACSEGFNSPYYARINLLKAMTAIFEIALSTVTYRYADKEECAVEVQEDA